MKPDSYRGHELRSTVHNQRSSRFPRRALLGVFALAAALVFFLLSRAGSFLVVDDPQRSDVIVVLEGSGDTPGYFRALHLHQEGYAGKVLLDANVNAEIFGKTEAQLATEYVHSIGQPSTEICPTAGTSVFAEAAEVQRCLQRVGASSAILMTSDFGTRRALSIFQKRLPQYRWSVAAASTPYHFAEAYWKHRGWAKTVLQEWEDFLWWKLVDQWRGDVVLH
ncbi:MAG: YdcF family protein [Candidatus Korobacteraceae bacterium]